MSRFLFFRSPNLHPMPRAVHINSDLPTTTPREYFASCAPDEELEKRRVGEYVNCRDLEDFIHPPVPIHLVPRPA